MSLEVRVDPLTGLKAIVAEDRAARDGGAALTATPAPPPDPATDPFAEGHEDRTPPELFALRDGGGGPDTPGWRVRVVPNRFPAVRVDAPEPPRDAARQLFQRSAATGAHEVVVSSPRPVASLGDLTAAELADTMEVWRTRMAHHAQAGAACVHLHVNEGVDGGASLAHTHAQLLALDVVPAAVARERERFAAYAAGTYGADLLGDLVQEEVKLGERLVAVDAETVLLSPFAARLPYALTIAPRTHRARFEEDGPLGAAMLADALRRLATVLGAVPPLNLWVRTAPRGVEQFCWRIDLVPRLTPLAGLELGTGLGLNVVSPERAAVELRAV